VSARILDGKKLAQIMQRRLPVEVDSLRELGSASRAAAVLVRRQFGQPDLFAATSAGL